ncbi:RAMP2 protein, partial [Nothoprocta pentlandii]|nr:RAMP2 protein [Nothoprocta pentlandii]
SLSCRGSGGLAVSGRAAPLTVLPCTALLGRALSTPGAQAQTLAQDAHTSPPATAINWTAQLVEEMYANISQHCWKLFVELMGNVSAPQLCEWSVISRPYSLLQSCLEDWADRLSYGYPNTLAESYIFQSHHHYFHNCTPPHQVLDPPEDVLLAMIIAPICLIPFLVTLVIWRSKDGKAQP